MDTSRISNYSVRQHVGISPQKSKEFDISLRRNHDNGRSEQAAYWAIFNTIIASILYYDLCYIQLLDNVSNLLIYVEWLICAVFTLSACYDIMIHIWLINFNDHHGYNNISCSNNILDHNNSIHSNHPTHDSLINVNNNGHNGLNSSSRFDISSSPHQHQQKHQSLNTSTTNSPSFHHDQMPLPPFEILHLYDEEERIVTTQQADLSSTDNSMNRSRRSQVTDKESLAEYLREIQEKELYANGS